MIDWFLMIFWENLLKIICPSVGSIFPPSSCFSLQYRPSALLDAFRHFEPWIPAQGLNKAWHALKFQEKSSGIDSKNVIIWFLDKTSNILPKNLPQYGLISWNLTNKIFPQCGLPWLQKFVQMIFHLFEQRKTALSKI